MTLDSHNKQKLPYTTTLAKRPVHPLLTQFAQEHLSQEHTRCCRVRALEAGAGGDCLFHSVAAALEQMIQLDPVAAQHVFPQMPLQSFLAGKANAVATLRDLSAKQMENAWSPEALLDYALVAALRQRHGTFEDELDPSDILNACGFDFQTQSGFHCTECESALAFQVEASGDAIMRLAYTAARRGGGERMEEIHVLAEGSIKLASLRVALGNQIRRPGNWHWGNQMDVRNLCEALNIGVLMFCDRLQDNGRRCFYNTGVARQDFPYWISLW